MRKRISTRALKILGVFQLSVILALAIAAGYFWMKPISGNAALPVIRALPLEPLASLQPQRAEYTNALSRPIFEATRRPWIASPQPEIPPVAEAVDPVKISLAGITISKGQAKALLRQQDSAAGAWFGEGDSVAGWRILRILPDQVKLSRGQDEQALTLYESSPE